MSPPHVVLASASPQRRAILEQLEVAVDVRPAGVEELASGVPEEVVIENALRKARAVAGESTEGSLVLGSDTVVAVDGDVLGKPRDAEEARVFLERLSGREHEVWSSLALIDAQGTEEVEAAVARVRFRLLTAADLDWYLATGEWEGRAGGYAIQQRGAALVEEIQGDYNCVVGLPVALLFHMAPDLIRR